MNKIAKRLRDAETWEQGDAPTYHERTSLNVLAAQEIERLEREVEQCHAKATCCCGSYVKQHGVGDGHSPVSMYARDLDSTARELAETKEQLRLSLISDANNEARANDAEAQAAAMRAALELAAGTDDPDVRDAAEAALSTDAGRKVLDVVEAARKISGGVYFPYSAPDDAPVVLTTTSGGIINVSKTVTVGMLRALRQAFAAMEK